MIGGCNALEVDMKVSFVDRGRGRPVVFLHGIASAGGTWQYQVDAFAGRYRVVALDLPGFGDCDALQEMTFEALSGWLQDFLVDHQLQEPVLVGHSFGGMIVQEYLAAFPGRAAGVVLYGTSPAFGPKDGPWQQAFIRARLQPLDEGKTMAELAPEGVQNMVGSGAGAEGIALATDGYGAVEEASFRAAVHCLADFDQRENLHKIDVPCLVLVGEEDGNAPARMMKKMAGNIRGSRYVCLPRLGHLAHLEDPALFNAALNDFLLEYF
jgi:3-oxoadipate enol-lactonase